MLGIGPLKAGLDDNNPVRSPMPPLTRFAFLAVFFPLVAAAHYLIRRRLGWPWSQAWLLARVAVFLHLCKTVELAASPGIDRVQLGDRARR